IVHVGDIAVSGRDLPACIVVNRICYIAGAACLILPHVGAFVDQDWPVVSLKRPAWWNPYLISQRSGSIQNPRFHDPYTRCIQTSREDVVNNIVFPLIQSPAKRTGDGSELYSRPLQGG